MSAPKGNMNALKNTSRIQRLTVGELPRQLNSAKCEARQYRRALEAAVKAAHGEISASHAHAVDTASCATMHAAICRWLFREKIDTMAVSDILATSREMLKAKQQRDTAVKSLGLDREEVSSAVEDYYKRGPAPWAPETARGEPSERRVSER